MASFKGGAFHGNTGEHPRQEDAIGIIEESLDRNRTGTVRHFPVELVRCRRFIVFLTVAQSQGCRRRRRVFRLIVIGHAEVQEFIFTDRELDVNRIDRTYRYQGRVA
jgi:hypothetical protein